MYTKIWSLESSLDKINRDLLLIIRDNVEVISFSFSSCVARDFIVFYSAVLIYKDLSRNVDFGPK
jgi:hypothetical protein